VPAQHRVLVPEHQQFGLLARSLRNTKTARAATRRTIKYMIWSGTRPAKHLSPPVGAENPVTLCDLGVFMDQAAEPVSPQHPDIRAYCGWM
jgi:hypothetical protein